MQELSGFEELAHVKSLDMIDAKDEVIWSFAKKNNFTIITQDSDFNDLNLLYGFPPKIVWLRIGNSSTKAIVEVLVANKLDIIEFVENANFGCLEIFRIGN